MKNSLRLLTLLLFSTLLSLLQAIEPPPKTDCIPLIIRLAGKSTKSGIALAKNPAAILTAEDGLIKLGPIYKRWSPDLETSVYSTMAEPRKDGSVPLVPKDSKAVIIFLHGSGTMKASGKNFAENMNAMRPSKVAAVGIDLPFHGDNQGSEKLKNMDNFMDWMHKFVTQVKTEVDETGRKIPIYMVGHSFGPGVIQEYIERYPKDLTNFLLMSPAGDFHPALKYTYEKVTTPGWKYLGGEPSVENAAGGEWAGQLDEQFTWPKKKPFDKIPGKMLIGALDEWWPGNKELAAKVGVAQPFEFEEPLDYFRKKYPKMDINVIPKFGHMIFEATAPNGRNLIRETIYDMVNLSEKERTPLGLSITPKERLALLYQNSPVFKEWIGDKYRHSFTDDTRTNGVLRDWESTKHEAWKKILETLPIENPEFFKAKGYSVAIATKKSEGKEPPTDTITTNLQHDLVAYLNADPKQKEQLRLTPDPETPKAISVLPQLTDREIAETKNGAVGPISLVNFEKRLLEKQASEIVKTKVGEKLVKLTFQLNGKSYENYVVDYSPEELNTKINQLYLKAHELKAYSYPGDTIEVLDAGLKWRFTIKDRKTVSTIQVTQ